MRARWQDKLSKEKQGETRVMPSRDGPHQAAAARGQTWCLAGALGSWRWGYLSWLSSAIEPRSLAATDFGGGSDCWAGQE